MLIEALGLSLIIGKVRGGKFSNLKTLDIKGWYLFVIAFILKITCVILKMNIQGFVINFIDKYFIFIQIIIYILVFIGLFLNFKNKVMIFILIGSLLNFIAIVSNEGKMPVSLDELEYSSLHNEVKTLKEEKLITHTLIDNYTKNYYLTDIISIPKPYPFAKIISVGDIFITLGVFLLIQKEMMKNNKEVKMLNFSYGIKL